jgi:methylmalonyl-CoA/ethylmalonyl-CoA epimerase
MSDASVGIRGIAQVAIPVRDTARAVAFYRDVLGLPLLLEAPPALAFVQCGAVQLMLSPPSAPEFDHPASIIYYDVPDVRAAHAALLQRGVTFRSAPHLVNRAPDHELWMAFLADPDGNVLALASRLPAGTSAP